VGTGWMLLDSNPGRCERFVSKTSRSDKWLTHLSVQWVLGIKQLGYEFDHSSSPNSELNEWSYSYIICLLGV